MEEVIHTSQQYVDNAQLPPIEKTNGYRGSDMRDASKKFLQLVLLQSFREKKGCKLGLIKTSDLIRVQVGGMRNEGNRHPKRVLINAFLKKLLASIEVLYLRTVVVHLLSKYEGCTRRTRSKRLLQTMR